MLFYYFSFCVVFWILCHTHSIKSLFTLHDIQFGLGDPLVLDLQHTLAPSTSPSVPPSPSVSLCPIPPHHPHFSQIPSTI